MLLYFVIAAAVGVALVSSRSASSGEGGDASDADREGFGGEVGEARREAKVAKYEARAAEDLLDATRSDAKRARQDVRVAKRTKKRMDIAEGLPTSRADVQEARSDREILALKGRKVKGVKVKNLDLLNESLLLGGSNRKGSEGQPGLEEGDLPEFGPEPGLEPGPEWGEAALDPSLARNDRFPFMPMPLQDLAKGSGPANAPSMGTGPGVNRRERPAVWAPERASRPSAKDTGSMKGSTPAQATVPGDGSSVSKR